MPEKLFVVVLGAGPDQREILRAVRRAGKKPVAFDKNPEASEQGEATLFYPLSNRDPAPILGTLKGLGITEEVAGVVAAGTEVPHVVATLQNLLGLPGMSLAAAWALKDKRLYKRALRAAGVPCTREAKPGDKAAVVKPIDGSGSRNVTVVETGPFSGETLKVLCGGWPYTLVEAYQPGPQISSETLIWDGHGFTVAFADRHYDHANMTHPKELGVSMPSRWESERPKAHAVIMQAAAVLGITRGTIKCDLVLTKQGPLIIECTSRLSGGPLAKLVREHSGIDYFKIVVEYACGIKNRGTWMNAELKKVSLDMAGDENDYDDVGRWIPKELPECV